MKNVSASKKCIVVFSGGQDSTVCLHWALKHFEEVRAVFFRYGQKHRREEKAAKKISSDLKVPLKILTLGTFAEIGGNSLVDHSLDLQAPGDRLPNTFVPGRNLIFLTLAAGYGRSLKIYDLVTGVCETDYSGYPDCRKNTIKSLQQTLRLGMEAPFTLHTPLMLLSKAETVFMAVKLKGLSSLAFSHTCYQGTFPPCGTCPACLLRAKGFGEAGVPDPLLQRAENLKTGTVSRN